MPKTVTIKAPTRDGLITVSGKVAWLYIHDKRVKFLLQATEDSNEVFLTHYASGYKLGSLTPIKLLAAHSYSTLTDREAAKRLINRLVVQSGPTAILAKINGAPVIN